MQIALTVAGVGLLPSVVFGQGAIGGAVRDTSGGVLPGVNVEAASPVDENLLLVERFTRIDTETLQYEFTVKDPTIWTKPWTAVVPMKKTLDRIYEYACHEGNYAMSGILAGARAQEKAADEAATKGK